MRMRLTSLPLLTAAALLACLIPLAANSQTDTALKLTTTVPQAAAEFRAGITDWQNFSPEASASHFAAAIRLIRTSASLESCTRMRPPLRVS